MSAQTVTIISGVLLLVVFALVAWNLRRHRDARKPERPNRRHS
jgi:lipopolysaccharide export system protein LptC